MSEEQVVILRKNISWMYEAIRNNTFKIPQWWCVTKADFLRESEESYLRRALNYYRYAEESRALRHPRHQDPFYQEDPHNQARQNWILLSEITIN